MSQQAGILFSAFEPSGDALAGPLISGLRGAYPDIPVSGFGGPQMRDAGAEMLQMTTDKAVMFFGAFSQVLVHRRRLAMLRGWLERNDLRLLVAVDSPAANWSVCELVRRYRPGAKIVHLAAPQLWAWAPWRIRKLRRLTDHVLCMLPFEPAWFGSRGVSASFVGHPMFDRAVGVVGGSGVGDGHRIAILPGSRAAEIRCNLPTMLRALVRLQEEHAGLTGTVCAADNEAAGSIRMVGEQTLGPGCWGEGLNIAVGALDETLGASTLACVVSGTATLNVARCQTPMVTIYHVNRWVWYLLSRWLIRTRTFTLPNLIAASDGCPPVVVELIPHFGAVGPLVDALDRLLTDPTERARQRRMLGEVTAHYQDTRYCERALAGLVERMGV